MPKNWFYKIVFLWFSVIFLTGNLCYAQTQFLEFKFGTVFSSPFDDVATQKQLTDFQRGFTISAGFGHELPNEFLRLYGEVSYCGKGEKYPLDAIGGQFSSFMSYFEACGNLRAYFLDLFYLGLGMYSGYCFNHKILSGTRLDYKKIDFGPRAAFGVELGLRNLRGNIEIAYEYGLVNISDRNDTKITNQAVLLTAGVQIKILKK